ncbi:MAG: NfeD family protein [Thermoguttaceae bacterium]
MRAGVAAGVLIAGLGVWGTGPLAAEQEKAPQPQAKQLGWVFRVELPITGQATERLRLPVERAIEAALAEGARAVLVFEFSYPTEQAEFARTTKAGVAYDLADFLSGPEVSRARTVAYLPQSVQGHAVLAVLACDQIVMAPEAELGPAALDPRSIDEAIRTHYRTIAGRRKKVPEEVALKLVDPSRELLEVVTDDGAVHYVGPEGLKQLMEKRRVLRQQKIGQSGRFSAVEALDRRFIDHLAKDRLELVQRLELSEPLRQGMEAAGPFRAVRVDIKGPVRADTVGKAQRMIREAVGRGDANFVCVWLDSAGGSPKNSMDLAQFLASDPDLKNVRTVAYIPQKALADAALIALGCDEIAMRPHARLGGEGDYVFSPKEVPLIVQTLRELLRAKTRSWSVAAAMFDSGLSVFRCTRDGQVGYFSKQELEEVNQENPGRPWTPTKEQLPAPEPGRPFFVTGENGATYLAGVRRVEDLAELRERYNLVGAPTLLEPTWVDVLVDALASPGLAVLLLIIGGAALYAELHSPGIGVGAFVATVCFTLFFWSRFLGGTAGWLEVMLFLAGISCLLLEVFVIPGFGIFGLGGGALILLSLILAVQTFLLPGNTYQRAAFEDSLLVIATSLVGMIAAVAALNRWLPHTPFLGQMVLHPPSEEEAEAISYSESLAHFESLVGARGRTTTPLVPSGKARFGKDLVDVMTEGEFVPRGAQVEVVQLRGNWLVVRPVEQTT